ncbi:hypothetical protein TKK_0003007 [Trichogramma kaykai]
MSLTGEFAPRRLTGATAVCHHLPGVRRRRQGATGPSADPATSRRPETAELPANCADATTITEAERTRLDIAANYAASGNQRNSSTGVATYPPGHAAATTDPATRPALQRRGPSPFQSAVGRRADTTAAPGDRARATETGYTRQLALFLAKHPQPGSRAPQKPPPTKLSLLRKRR